MRKLERLYDEYVNLQAGLDLLESDRQKLMDDVLTPAQRTQLAEIEEEFEETRKAGEAELEKAAGSLKAAVVATGASFNNGEVYQVIYTKGRTKWDDKMLQDMVFEFPRLALARKVGPAYGVIRLRKQKPLAS